jgi:hypothetical protein
MEIDQQLEPNLEDPDWRFPILECLVEGKMSSDQTEVRHISQRAKAFILIDGELYVDGSKPCSSHRKPTGDLVSFHQGGTYLDLPIQGSEENH